MSTEKTNKKRGAVTEREPRLLNHSTPFAIREAFNHLRTNLMYTLNDEEGCPIFAITSADESAGKSTVVANIAISYAMASKKVLLIDCDMRAPMQCKIFKMDKTLPGLSELLSGIEEDPAPLIHNTENEGVSLLLAGMTPPNPAELILSQRFEQYLKTWRMEYDAIFIDFPPVGIVTDTLAVNKLVTGYVFVVRSEKSDSRKITAALDAMAKVDAKVLGIILNDVNAKSYSRRARRGARSSYYESRYEKAHSNNIYRRSYEKAKIATEQNATEQNATEQNATEPNVSEGNEA